MASSPSTHLLAAMTEAGLLRITPRCTLHPDPALVMTVYAAVAGHRVNAMRRDAARLLSVVRVLSTYRLGAADPSAASVPGNRPACRTRLGREVPAALFIKPAGRLVSSLSRRPGSGDRCRTATARLLSTAPEFVMALVRNLASATMASLWWYFSSTTGGPPKEAVPACATARRAFHPTARQAPAEWSAGLVLHPGSGSSAMSWPAAGALTPGAWTPRASSSCKNAGRIGDAASAFSP